MQLVEYINNLNRDLQNFDKYISGINFDGHEDLKNDLTSTLNIFKNQIDELNNSSKPEDKIKFAENCVAVAKTAGLFSKTIDRMFDNMPGLNEATDELGNNNELANIAEIRNRSSNLFHATRYALPEALRGLSNNKATEVNLEKEDVFALRDQVYMFHTMIRSFDTSGISEPVQKLVDSTNDLKNYLDGFDLDKVEIKEFVNDDFKQKFNNFNEIFNRLFDANKKTVSSLDKNGINFSYLEFMNNIRDYSDYKLNPTDDNPDITSPNYALDIKFLSAMKNSQDTINKVADNVPKTVQPDFFDKMLREIKDCDPGHIRSSENFRNAKNAITDLAKMYKKMNEGGDVKKEEFDKKLTQAFDLTKIYVENKSKEKKRSNLAEGRLAIMSDIADRLKTACDEKLDSPLKTNKEVKDTYANIAENSINSPKAQMQLKAAKAYVNALPDNNEPFNATKADRIINATVAKAGKSKTANIEKTAERKSGMTI